MSQGCLLSKAVQLSNKAEESNFCPWASSDRIPDLESQKSKYSETSQTQSTLTHGTMSIPVEFSFTQSLLVGWFLVIPTNIS